MNGLNPEGRPKPENWHLEQLGEATVEHLMGLDLANKPEAQIPLLRFLAAMGVDAETLKGSKVAQALANSEAYREMVEQGGIESVLKIIE